MSYKPGDEPGAIIPGVPGGEIFFGGNENRSYLSTMAYDLRGGLAGAPEWHEGQSRRWTGNDYMSFQYWQFFEVAIPRARLELDIADQVTCANLVHAVHTALPYDEAERAWLFNATLDDELIPVNDRMDVVRRQEAHVTAAGLHKVIYGRDLVRRWWAWQRQADEFTGQDTVMLARRHLVELVQWATPEKIERRPHLLEDLKAAPQAASASALRRQRRRAE